MKNIIQILGLLLPSALFVGYYLIFSGGKSRKSKGVCWIFIGELLFVILSFFFSFQGNGSYFSYFVGSFYVGSVVSILTVFPLLLLINTASKSIED